MHGRGAPRHTPVRGGRLGNEQLRRQLTGTASPGTPFRRARWDRQNSSPNAFGDYAGLCRCAGSHRGEPGHSHPASALRTSMLADHGAETEGVIRAGPSRDSPWGRLARRRGRGQGQRCGQRQRALTTIPRRVPGPPTATVFRRRFRSLPSVNWETRQNEKRHLDRHRGNVNPAECGQSPGCWARSRRRQRPERLSGWPPPPGRTPAGQR